MKKEYLRNYEMKEVELQQKHYKKISDQESGLLQLGRDSKTEVQNILHNPKISFYCKHYGDGAWVSCLTILVGRARKGTLSGAPQTAAAKYPFDTNCKNESVYINMPSWVYI